MKCHADDGDIVIMTMALTIVEIVVVATVMGMAALSTTIHIVGQKGRQERHGGQRSGLHGGRREGQLAADTSQIQSNKQCGKDREC